MTPRSLEALNSINNNEQVVRITQEDFKEMLLDNYTTIVEGVSRHFQGIHIGEGVFMVKLLPKGWDSLFGTIRLDERTNWITKGTGLVLKAPCCKQK